MKKLTTIIFSLIIVGTLLSQVSNDDIDYYAEVDGVDWDADVGSTDNNPEAVWRVRSRENTAYTNSCDIDDYDSSLCIRRGSYAFTSGLGRHLRSRRDAPYGTNVRYNVFAFEKDGDNNCDHDLNDDFEHCGRGTISFTSHPVGEYHTYNWHNIQGKGWSDIRMRQFWSYANGQWGNPLKFGAIAHNQTKSHTNNSGSNRSGYGYTSTFSYPGIQNQSSPDVAYEFMVSEGPLIVDISISQTNFDGNLYLLKKDGSSYDLITTDLDERSPAITKVLDAGTYYVVFEGQDDFLFTRKGKFKLEISAVATTMTAGTISHPMPWINRDCKPMIPITNATEATSAFGTIQYDWLIAPIDPDPNDNTFYSVDRFYNLGPTLEPEEMYDTNLDIEYTRIAVSEGIDRASNTITIVALPNEDNNAIIKGQVTGRDGQSGVASIRVNAIPGPNTHGNCETYFDTTDANGFYEITNIYYGNNGDFTETINGSYLVFPEFEDHEFDPDTIQVDNFQSSARIKDNVNFKDITTFFIQGRVTQVDAAGTPDTCGVPGVAMYLNEVNSSTGELSLWETNEDGYYSISVQNQGEHTVRPEFLNHEFSPMISNSYDVTENITGVNFEDTKRSTISGSVKACGGFIFGRVGLQIEDTLSCFIFDITTDASGNFEIEVPAGTYRIVITDEEIGTLESGYFIENITAFFNRAPVVDASEEDGHLDLVYRQEPIIAISGLPQYCDQYVVEQYVDYDLEITITESNTDGCLLDTGSLKIIDEVSGREVQVFPISQGKVLYTVSAGEPNLAPDHNRNLIFEARHIQDSTINSTLIQLPVIIEGAKAREGTFSTVSPQVPFFILRDPPGDGSFSYLEESSTNEMSLGFSILKGGSVNIWRKARMGVDFSSGAGVTTNNKVWGDIGRQTTVSASYTRSAEAKLSFTHQAEYKTSDSDDPAVMGAGGDLYVGAAMILKYAKSDVITFDKDLCQAVKTVEFMMGDAEMSTKFFYTDYHIRHTEIPDLEDLRDAQTDPTEVEFYQDQIDVWNQTLELNQQLKNDAEAADASTPSDNKQVNGNVSWSGETSQEYSTNTTSSVRAGIEFNLEINRELSVELGYEVAGKGRSGGATIRTRMEVGASAFGELLSSRTTGFVLTDDDKEDRFVTKILKDPVYNVPVFRNEVSVTSCPHEYNTAPIDGPDLQALNPVVINIPPDGNAGFTLRLTNLSQDEQTRSYYVDIVQGSNPHGANINASFPLLYEDVEYDESIDQFISISRLGADQSIYSFEGIEFIAYPAECDNKDDFTTSTASVSAHFDSDCSDVTMMEPQAGWINNLEGNNLRRIHIKDYDESKLTEIIIQYTPAGQNSWNTAIAALTPVDLNDNATNGTFANWDLSNVPDGSYDVRLKLVCPQGTLYTSRTRGLIDRAAANVFGLPMPIDDIYDISDNDIIAINMTEDIDCNGAVATLTDLETGEVLPNSMTCANNQVQIVPNAQLESRDPSAYRVSITGLQDIADNVSAEARWVFIVGDYEFDPDCSPVSISNNNTNQDGISQSVYTAQIINSDGSVVSASTVEYKASESVNLEPGFTVNSEGAFEANIETCIE